MEIMPIIKYLPHHLQKYGVFVATIVAVAYHWAVKHSEESCDLIASLFDLAVHISDSKKELDDKQKMEEAIQYVANAIAEFRPWEFEYWKTKGLDKEHLQRALEVCIEAKKAGIQKALVPIIVKGFKRI